MKYKIIFDSDNEITNCYDCPLCYDNMCCILLGKSFFSSSDRIDPAIEKPYDCPLRSADTDNDWL